MKHKFVALAFLLMLMLTVFPLVHNVAASGTILILSDAELMLSEFAKQWGPGTLTKVDVSGPGVQFNFAGLTSADTGVGDNFAVNKLAGGAYKDYVGFAGYYDFSGYGEYRAGFTNMGTGSIDICLFINTGWTKIWADGSWTGPDGYGASLARDTCWQSAWINVPAGTTRNVALDFSSATCYNAGDDPVVAWQHADGTSGVTVRRLDELSNIGFQVLGDGDVSLVVNEYPGQVIPEVPWGTILISAVMAIAVIGFIGFKHFKPKLPHL